MISYFLGTSEFPQHLRINASFYIDDVRYVKDFNFYISDGFAYALERVPSNLDELDAVLASEKISLYDIHKVVIQAAEDWRNTMVFMENLKKSVINSLKESEE